MNHDYTEADEEDEFKESLFHLIHLLQCNHGSETNQQILNKEELIFRAFLSDHKFLGRSESMYLFGGRT